ncbi:MAG: hypothetical protein IPL09_01835 [Bacteroidetes bacterium]|jgi:hypothetical protein|nr:hypothetical protein [Bacteroidota bacterium]HMT36273.1 hypothetical protein [Chitinophagaceae bacterium]MBK6818374.1 hypothetical protein [Bacteroidota bacterium]MBK7040412.1 hypothetical protein [Bacteroidota bacterium]MBK7587250.1 hypothetical protein [Bacteroidota bacterium]
MSIKYTPATLKKFEELYDEIGYSIRFEKGNFNSGYCILLDKKIVVVNKFLTLEGRINALIDILPSITFDCTQLNTDVRHFYELAMASPTKNNTP